MSIKITAQMVKDLREQSKAPMMDCKKALTAAGGDMAAASQALSEQGVASAEKRSTRIAAEGVVASAQSADGKYAILIEVNCETDFVAKEPQFVEFVNELASSAVESRVSSATELMALEARNGKSFEACRCDLVAKIGENILSPKKFVNK